MCDIGNVSGAALATRGFAEMQRAACRLQMEQLHMDRLLAARLRAARDWVVRNPVLSRGWDDWSLLVRDEGWR